MKISFLLTTIYYFFSSTNGELRTITISVKNIASIKVSNTSHEMLISLLRKHTLKGIIVAQ